MKNARGAGALGGVADGLEGQVKKLGLFYKKNKVKDSLSVEGLLNYFHQNYSSQVNYLINLIVHKREPPGAEKGYKLECDLPVAHFRRKDP